jgi:hypothetical protein
MKYMNFQALAAVAVAMFAFTQASAQNSLVDPSFEGTLTFDGPPFVGTWEGFNAGGSSTSEFSTEMPRTGAQSLELNIGPDANLFAGAFQDVLAAAGSNVTFSVWHKDLSPGNGQGIEMRMEYRNSTSDTEISRTANATPATLGAEYELFSLSGVVPAGADLIRAVYAIQSFGGTLNQQIFVDDASLTGVIPEPASIVLLGLSGLALVGIRRHRS